MKKSIIFFSFIALLLVSGCGPAAEDRAVMHSRAKVFQDSLANIIRTQIAEAEGPQPPAPVVVDTTAQKTRSANAPAK